jgi:hypothetical protein
VEVIHARDVVIVKLYRDSYVKFLTFVHAL